MAYNKEWLEPRYDSRQSFYKKAYIVRDGKIVKLYSYDTEIATINYRKKEGNRISLTWAWDYSNTTLRHLKEFLAQETGVHYSKRELYEITDEYKEECERKEKARIEKEKIRLKKEKENKKKISLYRAKRNALKTKLKKEITKELEGTCSKSEINKLVMIELNQEYPAL